MARLSLKLWLSKKLGRAYWEEQYNEVVKESESNAKKLELKRQECESYAEVTKTQSHKIEEAQNLTRIARNELWEVRNRLQKSECQFEELNKATEEHKHLSRAKEDGLNKIITKTRQKEEYYKGRLEEEKENVEKYSAALKIEQEGKDSLLSDIKSLRKQLFSLQGVNARYKKQVAQLKAQLTELQQDLDEDESIAPML